MKQTNNIFVKLTNSYMVMLIMGLHLEADVTMKASNGESTAGAYFYRCDAFSSFIRWKAVMEYFIIVT